MPITDANANLIAIIINASASVAMQIIAALHNAGLHDVAEQVEAPLARSDANAKLLIQRSREARGLPPLAL